MKDRFETFTTHISKITKYIKKLKSVKSSKFNLTGPCVYYIYYLYKHPEGLTARELSLICNEDKGAISRTQDYLETNGYVICNENTKKCYNATLQLTPKGKLVGEEFVKIIDNLLVKASAGITEEERTHLYSALEKISNNLQKICDDIGENYD